MHVFVHLYGGQKLSLCLFPPCFLSFFLVFFFNHVYVCMYVYGYINLCPVPMVARSVGFS